MEEIYNFWYEIDDSAFQIRHKKIQDVGEL